MAEVLIRLVARCGEPWALDAIQRLDESRLPSRRERVAIDYDALRTVIYHSLVENGHTDYVRGEIEHEAEQTVEGGDVNELLSCCLTAVGFDPDLADKF